MFFKKIKIYKSKLKAEILHCVQDDKGKEHSG